MPDRRLDVLAIGNAIVDVIADADDDFLAARGHAQGRDAADRRGRGDAALRRDGRRRARLSGGSAGEHRGGHRGARACARASSARSRDDQLGEILPARHPQPGRRVRHAAAGRRRRRPARCLILVTPDAQRTMNTFLGAAQMLGPEAVDAAQVADAAILYLEGYLWDPADAALRDGARRWTPRARPARKVAFTLSDSFSSTATATTSTGCSTSGRIDILFANEAEIDALAGMRDSSKARSRRSRRKVETLVVTRSEEGALAVARRRARRRAGRADRASWSIRPAPATCSPPASSPAKRAAWASSSRCGWARSAPPK